MATINIHDLVSQDDGDVRRLKGISTLGFTTTEVRVDMGFQVSWKVRGVMDRSLSKLLQPYNMSSAAIQTAVNNQVKGEIIVEDFHPEGRFSVELPFEIVVNITHWYEEDKDLLPPELWSAVLQVLCLYIEANVVPDFHGSKDIFQQPDWPETS